MAVALALALGALVAVWALSGRTSEPPVLAEPALETHPAIRIGIHIGRHRPPAASPIDAGTPD